MDFDKSIEYVLENEGGFVDDPHDGGGATNFGITETTLTIYRNKSTTKEDVQNLNKDEAKLIYKKYFWDALELEKVPDPLCTAIMDMSANLGCYGAVKLAQKALGFHDIDGVIGPKTIGALQTVDVKDFIFKLSGVVQDKYVDLVFATPKQICFLKGWLARARKLLTLT